MGGGERRSRVDGSPTDLSLLLIPLAPSSCVQIMPFLSFQSGDGSNGGPVLDSALGTVTFTQPPAHASTQLYTIIVNQRGATLDMLCRRNSVPGQVKACASIVRSPLVHSTVQFDQNDVVRGEALASCLAPPAHSLLSCSLTVPPAHPLKFTSSSVGCPRLRPPRPRPLLHGRHAPGQQLRPRRHCRLQRRALLHLLLRHLDSHGL
jgi:hypothetical protein